MSGTGYVALPSESADHDRPSTPTPTTTLLSSKSEREIIYKTAHGGYLKLAEDGRSYTYAYGPSGLAGLFHNSFALRAAVFASLGGLLFGYDQGVIANILVMKEFLARWPVGPWEKGLMTAMLELGSLVGALSAGLFADLVSRRTAIVTACLVFCIGSTLQFAAQALPHLIVGRAIGGLGVGALSTLTPLYMAEISPPEVRGSLMALEQLSIVVGAVVGFWTGFLTRSIPSSWSWRLPLLIQLFPATVLLVGAMFRRILPPSPRLLVAQEHYDEAATVLRTLRGDEDILVQLELLEMRTEVLMTAHAKSLSPKQRGLSSTVRSELRIWGRLFNKTYRKRTSIGVMMMVFQQWSGINALLYYGPTLLVSIGLKGDLVTLLVAGGVGIVQALSVLPVIIFIDRLGRRPLLRWGSIVMAFSHVLIALLISTYASDWSSNVGAAWVAVGCVYLYTAAYGMSYGPIGWILPSEVFPLSMRSKGVALSTASNWLNNFLIGLVTPALLELSAKGTFMIFGVACFAGYLWSTYVVPETGNVSLEEMDAVFGSNAGVEDVRLKHEIEHELGVDALIAQISGGPSSAAAEE
ncbi:MFS monosaccharide transporter [Phanerochaete sordida]|uniref:MFS monosaccharide transporter n=1 Tax=Phanerochaete sordida TaxID=48140 RepID=A0A9P3LKM0_9APHY|nr:MFS monosaccharide transporter [Phanerochaete sordida]